MVGWNGIFRLFRFSGLLGQPREVHPKFWNEMPENDCSIRTPTRNFRNFWSNGKRPRFLGLARFYVLRDQTKITCCESIHVLHEAPFQINHAEASCFMRCNFLAQFQFVLGRGTDSFKKLTCFLIRNLSPTLWDSAQIFHRSFGTRMYLAVGERVLSSEAWEA